MMDLITGVTGKQDMFYVGHSMGTTMFFAMSNSQPMYRDRIKAMFALAPIARVDHMVSPLRYLARFAPMVGVSMS
jgi:lysosomal acid lipase/cholesteryl ester hydrolase